MGGSKGVLTNEKCDDAKLLASDEGVQGWYTWQIFQHLNELHTDARPK